MSNEKLQWPKLTLPPANGLCSRCISDRERTATNGIMVLAYCVHAKAGGIMSVVDGTPSGRWTIITPIGAEDFADYANNIATRADEMARLMANSRIEN